MRKKDYYEVKVIAVEHRMGQWREKETHKYPPYPLASTVEYKLKDPSEDAPRKTLVLYTSGGELKTKEFAGEWTLEQVNRWERERFADE